MTVTQAQLEKALTLLDQVMASVNIGRGSYTNQERTVNRLEAGAKELHYATGWTPASHDRQLVEGILAAADAVMFSDEAVERTAHAIWNATGHDPNAWVYMAPETHRKQRYMSYAKAAIAALKGDA